MGQAFDLILRGARIVDGSGGASYVADIGLLADKIAAVGDLSGSTGASGDVALHGLAVAPGFIDVHTHDDRLLLTEPDMLPKLTQGVTTVVTGNCGISLAPMAPGSAIVPPLDLVVTPDWRRYACFADYLEDLDRHPAAVNSVALVGHTTLRIQAMSDFSRAADSVEVARMRGLFEDALRCGAWGLSSGTFYPPAAAAPTEEIIAVGEPLARYNGVFATHMRNESDLVMESLDETFRIGRELGVGVIISHHKLAGIPYHGQSTRTLQRIREAMRRQPVCLDCYPYHASSTMLRMDMVECSSRVLVAWSTPHPGLAGRLLSDIAAEWDCDLREAVARLTPAGAIYFLMDENDVRAILAFEGTMIGSDGLPHDSHPHPRLWGAFPRVIGHYARDVGLFSLETAVHKMSGMTAARLGLTDRGLIEPGYYADLVVFDPAVVDDTASFEAPVAPARGIHSVYVNGTLAMQDGRCLARGGRVLRRNRHAG